MQPDAFIVCDGLVKIYKVASLEVVALQGLDLQVARGETMGIVGASGSGKSTLMNILGGLDRPSAGRVQVDGLDLLKLSDKALSRYRRSSVGFVWQQGARNLLPYLTALENVRLPMTISGRGWGKTGQRAEALLEAVGLAGRLHHRLQEMSGGEQQRVAIAVALANNPSLILADEPTGEVDTATAAGIFQVFQELKDQFGVTTLIVSHDLGIARYVDRVVAIRDGKTSSETVRQVNAVTRIGGDLNNKMGDASSSSGDVPAPDSPPEEAVFEEVVLLDSAGRLQVPREYLQQLGVQGRVQLELREDGILIRPFYTEQASTDIPEGAPTEHGNQVDHTRSEGQKIWRGWWQRLRRSAPKDRSR